MNSRLPNVYDLFFDIKTEQELNQRINELVAELSSIAVFRRDEGKSIDHQYIIDSLNLKDINKPEKQ